MTINKKIAYPIILVVCFVLVFSLGTFTGIKITYHVPQPDTIEFSLFWDAYNKLKENFINPEKIDNEKIIFGAIQGMTSSLEDPYTSFFNPEDAQRFREDLSGSFEGIGAEIGIKKDLLTIIAPLPGTPAIRAGLKAGDVIVKIDGKDSTQSTIEEAVSLIRGEKGTPVVLTVFRSSWDRTKDIEIIRGTIKIPSISWELKKNNIAYIQIFHFDDRLSSEFRKTAMEILRSPAKKIILDLRNNPGGYLETAIEISGWFLEKGQTITIEDFGPTKQKKLYTANGPSELLKYPIVVLINEGSASASEILAGALRDNRGVKLIGEKSFGKGSVQEVVNLKGGSFLKITIAKWLTPNGDSISEVGLEPDIKIEETEEDFELERDPQLEKALEIIGEIQ